MDIAKLISLRPKGQSSADHQAALDRIDALKAETARKIVEQKELRPRVLLTATSAQIQDIERSIAELELDLERFRAMQAAILPQLEVAKTAERHAEVRKIAKQAKALHAAYLKWVRTEYPALIERLIEGFTAGDRAIGASFAAWQALATVPDIQQQILDEVGGLATLPNPGAETVLVKELDTPQFGHALFTIWQGARTQPRAG